MKKNEEWRMKSALCIVENPHLLLNQSNLDFCTTHKMLKRFIAVRTTVTENIWVSLMFGKWICLWCYPMVLVAIFSPLRLIKPTFSSKIFLLTMKFKSWLIVVSCNLWNFIQIIQIPRFGAFTSNSSGFLNNLTHKKPFIN